MLQQFQLERQPYCGQIEIPAVCFQYGRASNIRLDELVNLSDSLPIDFRIQRRLPLAQAFMRFRGRSKGFSQNKPAIELFAELIPSAASIDGRFSTQTIPANDRAGLNWWIRSASRRRFAAEPFFRLEPMFAAR